MNRTNPAENLRRSALRPEAFGDFFDAHFEDLLRYLTRRTCDAEAGLDLTAECFAQAYLSRRRFRGSTHGEAAAWLYRIAKRQLARYFKKGAPSDVRFAGSGSSDPSSISRPSGRLSGSPRSPKFARR